MRRRKRLTTDEVWVRYGWCADGHEQFARAVLYEEMTYAIGLTAEIETYTVPAAQVPLLAPRFAALSYEQSPRIPRRLLRRIRRHGGHLVIGLAREGAWRPMERLGHAHTW